MIWGCLDWLLGSLEAFCFCKFRAFIGFFYLFTLPYLIKEKMLEKEENGLLVYLFRS